MADALDMTDWVIEIDNKSLTHRPDLWGHRGIAREVAAIFGRALKPLDARACPALGSGAAVPGGAWRTPPAAATSVSPSTACENGRGS